MKNPVPLLKSFLAALTNLPDAIPHLPLQESILDLVVSIMDMPGRTVFSQRVAPGISHSGIPVTCLSSAYMLQALKINPGAYAKN